MNWTLWIQVHEHEIICCWTPTHPNSHTSTLSLLSVFSTHFSFFHCFHWMKAFEMQIFVHSAEPCLPCIISLVTRWPRRQAKKTFACIPLVDLFLFLSCTDLWLLQNTIYTAAMESGLTPEQSSQLMKGCQMDGLRRILLKLEIFMRGKCDFDGSRTLWYWNRKKKKVSIFEFESSDSGIIYFDRPVDRVCGRLNLQEQNVVAVSHI